MPRRVLITGSAGYLGRALRAAFEEQGDSVVGVDRVSGPNTDIISDLEDIEFSLGSVPAFDILVANAKSDSWKAHHYLATCATSSIINISSIYGVLGNDPAMYEGTEVEPTPAWYAASKGALISLTRWQACNLAPVRSNCVCPGGIERGHSAEFKSRYSAKVPLGRMAREADIVPLVLFLADPVRAAYITGQCIAVDGGLSVMA